MTAKEAACAIKEWAIDSGIIHRNRPVALTQCASGSSKGQVGVALEPYTDVIRKREVTYVAYDEMHNTVTILTAKRIPDKARKLLPAAIGASGVNVKFGKAGVAQAGGQPPPSPHGPCYSHKGKYACGSSIHVGNYVGAGTLGCLLRDATGKVFGLSNNHVCGDCSFAEVGVPIIAPGSYDVAPGRVHPFTIGTHHRSLPMLPGHPSTVDVRPNTDAAIFAVAALDLLSSSQGGFYDTPVSIADAFMGLAVQKVGRTSGLTHGEVIGIAVGADPVSYSVCATNSATMVYFEGAIIVKGRNGQPFSQPGDSGSLVVASVAGEQKAVGIVYAGDNSDISFVLPLAPILSSLGLSLVAGHNV